MAAECRHQARPNLRRRALTRGRGQMPQCLGQPIIRQPVVRQPIVRQPVIGLRTFSQRVFSQWISGLWIYFTHFWSLDVFFESPVPGKQVFSNLVFNIARARCSREATVPGEHSSKVAASA